MNGASAVGFLRRVSALTVGLWVLLWLQIHSAQGYYHIPNLSNQGLHTTENQAPQSGPIDSFALYDQHGPLPPGGGKAAPLPPRSERFVPADSISANQPIHMVIRRPIDPANEVANNLYANQKLKRLLDEYVDLQRRAREVIGDVAVTVGFSANRPTGKGVQENFHQQMEVLNREQIRLSRAFPTVTTPGYPVGLNQGTGDSGPILSGGLDHYRVADTQGPLPAGRADMDARPTGTHFSPGRHSDASLPWIFEVVLNTISYIQANKVETGIICVLILIVLMGFSKIRRR